MPLEQNLTPLTFPAGGDISTLQFCCVSINSSGQIAVASAAGACDGILQDKPDGAGRAGAVACAPGQVSFAKLGTGGATRGDYLEIVGSAGGLTTKSSGKIIGKALQTGLSGELIAVLTIFQR